jgi:putative membrane-bound dehydrogenase-like protein
MLKDVCPTIFSVPIPPEHLARIDQYTRELADKMEQVALDALGSMKPARISFGIGQANFSANRRTKGGPVDHDLPVLAVTNPDGTLRAIYTSYACHCVTLSNNKISGDWAGSAQEAIQRNHPGIIALTSVGCGADSNPSSGVTGDKVDAANDQGAQVATEVERLLKQGLTPLTEKVVTRIARITLDFDKHPTREEWEAKAKLTDAVGYHARVQLAKLDRGEKLQTQLSYPIQTWTFGKNLALVFLPGEVVVDYSLRLKREFDHSRIWVNGYSNDEPCYIPSERILKEGGYEGGEAMVYYDRPTRFAPGLEQKIVDEVHRQLPAEFLAPKGTEGTSPRSALDSLKLIRTKPGLEVELVAAEPLIESPVAIDWGADGRLWVCEMYDYPMGIDGKWKHGGRIRVLQDTDGDGNYDKTTLFLENIPFPTGVTAWGKGVLVCAAPDILYAEDTDGDGKADVVRKLFSGFYTDNFQARVNSLSLGLDNWIYGANGLLGGVIRGESNGREIDIRGQDFRMKPDTGEFEAASGLTQQGRVRDDFGNWYGCDNSASLRNYPIPDHYIRRNPSVPAPNPSVYLPSYPDSGRIYPISRPLERFNDPSSLNHVTSACGLAVYRDALLGPEYNGNAFVCEPVHNLVHREVVEAVGAHLASHRAPDEQTSEFLASADNWFRPVQVRTGPDGALYVVDMYRFLIEHPRWIQADRLAAIDARAGADMGRIYRVVPTGKKLRPVPNLSKLPPSELVHALETPNGTERDRIHLYILNHPDRTLVEPLTQLAAKPGASAVRIQAMSALAIFGPVPPEILRSALSVSDVQIHAIRLAEPWLKLPKDRVSAEGKRLREEIFSLTGHSDPRVRQQLALSLGESNDPRAATALGELAKADLGDPWMRAAVLSSAVSREGAILTSVIASPEESPGRAEMISRLVATAGADGLGPRFIAALAAILPSAGRPLAGWQWSSLAALFNRIDYNLPALHQYLANQTGSAPIEERLGGILRQAKETAKNETASLDQRESAILLLGRDSKSASDDIKLLATFVSAETPPGLRKAALSALRQLRGQEVASELLARWSSESPAARTDMIGVLLSRDNWIAPALAAVRSGDIQASEIPLADRQRLLKNANIKIRDQAQALFAAAGTSTRNEVIQKYRGALSISGVVARGAETFAKNCSTCHLLEGIGHEVGPNLAPLHDKDPEYLLKNILDPNAAIEPRFVSYTIETRDGRSLTGVIRAEASTSLTLVQGGGIEENILRHDITQIRASGLSLMPEGLEQAMSPQDLADVIAFIKQTVPPKVFPGNQPAIVKAANDRSLYLPAKYAEIYGDQIAFENEFHNIGMWLGAKDRATWTVDAPADGAYDVLLDFACDAGSAGNTFALATGGAKLTAVVSSTGTWASYQKSRIGRIALKAGQQRITFRTEGELRNALLDLRAVLLVPTGSEPRWPGSDAP